MTRHLAAAAVALIAACGPPRPAEKPPDSRRVDSVPAQSLDAAPADTTPDDTASDDGTAPGACSYALDGKQCESNCTYATGSCACLVRWPCTGVRLTDERMREIEAGPHYYTCTTTDPTVLRSDGCPVNVPSGPCSESGKTCEYPPPCGGTHSTATCAGGAWNVQTRRIPPPP